ncbi:hypothetical protein [Variovorax gossypii]|jgi:hypothetical protein|uniref:hypothetical protein n=1 Tax=uncultured Variovorax sp. TaxID=114708 RepID=UPI0026328887|nr:hypothetical protein [uncultured Variovorax sp.]
MDEKALLEDLRVVELKNLRDDFQRKHRECEKAAHALAAALPVGAERNRAFDLYEIIRTAPREARS